MTQTEHYEEIEENPDAVAVQDQGQVDGMQLRLQLLALSKEILEHRTHLMWETHKDVVDVSIEDVVVGARKLFDFVSDG